MLAHLTPALILSDLRFEQGKMSGIDFYHYVRNNPRIQNVPFLNITLANEYQTRATSFLVDSVSIYMVIVYLFVGFVITFFGTLYIELKEKYSERYYSLILLLIGCLLQELSQETC
jgi:NADH:ubiquinone oxidoreductase subunit 5 (subunit L)/multisubunit Na+/H+ antiporter MnhA subunit